MINAIIAYLAQEEQLLIRDMESIMILVGASYAHRGCVGARSRFQTIE